MDVVTRWGPRTGREPASSMGVRGGKAIRGHKEEVAAAKPGEGPHRKPESPGGR